MIGWSKVVAAWIRVVALLAAGPCAGAALAHGGGAATQPPPGARVKWCVLRRAAPAIMFGG